MTDNIRNISIAQYTYELPEERIALHPLDKRDESNLLIYKDGDVSKEVFKNISSHLPGASLMVFNNTRVVQARLLFRKPSGAWIEIFCLEPAGTIRDIQLAFQDRGRSSWFCLVGNAKKWKQGILDLTVDENLTLSVEKGERIRDGYIIHFQWSSQQSFAEVLDVAGKTPLPPYIGRKAEKDDKHRYQTIFARHSGSVAAPTSGLHFTDKVMESLEQQHIEKTWVTLHVGAGTFKPVSSDTIGNHEMHHEQIIVQKETIQALLNHCQSNIISVGTTSLRTLESLYWLGVKLKSGYTIPESGFVIDQWEPYTKNEHHSISPAEAMDTLLEYMSRNAMTHIHGETSMIIVPGYKVKMASVLVTNFHQPGSTLLLLVAAFCGQDWKKIYDFALDNDFRFLSYGDSCLLFRNDG
ncbi:MAG: S-adenosylmethionine:tRNA ribosyltransferase-isomerase, partial [Bacteroidetes bacterium]